MPDLKVRKVFNNSNEGFSETLKFNVCHCGNVSGNNNKFYCIEIQKNSAGDYRVFTHYGRLGKTNIYEVRDAGKDQNAAEKEFETILKKKLKGKKIKDEETGEERIEKYVEVETIKPNVGSENICNKAITTVTASTKAVKIDTSAFDATVAKLVNQIIEENIHQITSMTTFKLSANGFETPLGPVTLQHIERAKKPLDTLKSLLKGDSLDHNSKSVVECNNEYFSLIPHAFGHKIVESDWILDSTKLMNEFDLLDQLSSAVTMGASLNQDTKQRMNALGSDIDQLKDSKIFGHLEKYVEDSKAANHRGMDVWHYKVKNIFEIKIPSERSRFDSSGKQLGNLRELFHGTKNCNILSILKNGLMVPPCNSPGVSGRMFGDGVYFANNSTKSMNYSTNFWNQSFRNKYDNIFLLVADVAMGKTYETTSQLYNGVPSSYNSIHAKKGSSLHNDEFIVKALHQCSLKYLIELKK